MEKIKKKDIFSTQGGYSISKLYECLQAAFAPRLGEITLWMPANPLKIKSMLLIRGRLL